MFPLITPDSYIVSFIIDLFSDTHTMSLSIPWTMIHTVWFIHYGNVGNMTETQFLSHEMKYCLNLTNPICAWRPEWWYHFNRILEVILELFGKKDPSDNLDLLQGLLEKGMMSEIIFRRSPKSFRNWKIRTWCRSSQFIWRWSSSIWSW